MKQAPVRPTMIGLRLQPDELELLDSWIAEYGEMRRPEALRKMLRLVAMRVPGAQWIASFDRPDSVGAGAPSLYRNHNAPYGLQIGVKLSEADLKLLDLWIAANAPEVSRPEALRRILRLMAMRVPK